MLQCCRTQSQECCAAAELANPAFINLSQHKLRVKMVNPSLSQSFMTCSHEKFRKKETLSTLFSSSLWHSMSKNPLSAVSSFYGPGSIACWYLTAFSVLISWTVHPRKREKDSIDVNLIATLTFPCTAAGHLVWQTSLLLKNCQEDSQQEVSTGVAACDVRRSAALIEAPFVVVQTSCTVYTTLIIVGASKGCLRRASLTGLVGAFCLAVESYMYLSASKPLRFLYVTDASTHDLVSPRRWVVDETWET